RSFQRLDRELMVLPANRMSVITGCCDLEDQRLTTSARCGVELLDDLRSWMLMYFVHGREVNVETVHLGGIGRKRPEPGRGRQHSQIVHGPGDPCLQRRT